MQNETFQFRDDLEIPVNRIFIPTEYEQTSMTIGRRLTPTQVEARVRNLMENGLALGGRDVREGHPRRIDELHSPDQTHMLNAEFLDSAKAYDLDLAVATSVPMLAATEFGDRVNRIVILSENQNQLHLPDKSPVLAYQNLRFSDLEDALTGLMVASPDGVSQITALGTHPKAKFWEERQSNMNCTSVAVRSKPNLAVLASRAFLHGIKHLHERPDQANDLFDIALLPLDSPQSNHPQANRGVILYPDPA